MKDRNGNDILDWKGRPVSGCGCEYCRNYDNPDYPWDFTVPAYKIICKQCHKEIYQSMLHLSKKLNQPTTIKEVYCITCVEGEKSPPKVK